MFLLGSVPAAVRVLHATAEPSPSTMALRILKSVIGRAKSCAALCEDMEEAVTAVMSKMMKAIVATASTALTATLS
ncbi:hypothetical protein E2562_034706 [Oryza meyeriana var. granulata]|uniref:Uncharacterized protein n=1 Tax=Oryza meyeriana var. granulata TaxID=110450 RepID=A0A6G1CB64_9ORYZ|nr:hypothetical protein E2562_034706 [Oryza meyeriana var. granulata]